MTRLYLQHRPRVILVNTVMTGLLLAVVGKLFYVQVLNHDLYQARAQRQSTEREQIPAIRGSITDRNGETLTSNIIHYSFAADPQVLENPDSLSRLFAAAFHRPASYYRKRLRTNRSFVWLERNVPRRRCETLLDSQVRGLMIRREVRRRYPYGHIAGPLVGFTDVDGKGISGLELKYDPFLRGENGWQVIQRNAKGRVLPSLKDNGRAPRNGARVRMTIDIDYQSILQEEMARAFEELAPRSIQGILMDPRTGEILALAQQPSFDPNRPATGPRDHQRLLAVTDMYEPGSTLKVVAATAALEAGVYTPSDQFDCEEGEFAYHNLLIRDTYPRGVLSFAEIMAHSSNIGIIKVAESIGPELLYKYCCRYGLGARTGIDMPGESPGLLRDPSEWSAISTGEIAMGQEVGVTTLQLALIYSAIANGGMLMQPYLVSQVLSPEGEELFTAHPRAIRRVASPATMEQLRRMLYVAVETGTGSEARLPGYTMAGKTGTAQKFLNGKYSDREFMATFAAIFPAERPRLVCVVTVDCPRYGSHFGGEAAAPIASNTIKRILNLDDDFYQPPRPVITAERRSTSTYLMATAGRISDSSQPRVVPDFRGVSLRKAMQLSRRTGVPIQVEGSGTVSKQSLEPGIMADQDQVCLISLSAEGDRR